jgi:hypothetical protein
MSKNEVIENPEVQALEAVEQPSSREGRKNIEKKPKIHVEEADQSRTQKKMKKPKVRLIPIWLRIVVILVFCAVSLAAGLAIGYGVIGDGKPSDVFQKETWQHIVDIVVKES